MHFVLLVIHKMGGDILSGRQRGAEGQQHFSLCLLVGVCSPVCACTRQCVPIKQKTDFLWGGDV